MSGRETVEVRYVPHMFLWVQRLSLRELQGSVAGSLTMR